MLDKNEAHQESLDRVAAELMQDGEAHCPAYTYNIAAALAACSAQDSDKIEALLRARDPAAFDLIELISHNYCAELAMKEAVMSEEI